MIHIVPIANIAIGNRRREEMGNLEELAASIQEYGLLHPVTIDGEGRLVAGHRRLEACRRFLEWTHIPAQNLGELTEEQLREIELEENLRRKDLTPYERSRTMMRYAETAAGNLREEADEPSAGEGFLPDSGKKGPSYGRPAGSSKPDAEQRVSERIQVPQQRLNEARRHVETAEQFPFMQQPDWKQSHVLEAREHLQHIPEEQKSTVTAMMNEPGVPPSKALQMLSNLRHMPDSHRQKLVTLYESPDLRDRRLAKTEAIENPPTPDPRLIKLKAAQREVKECVKLFPGDPLTPRFDALVDDMDTLIEITRKAHQERISALLEKGEVS